mmetsp:Transcript_4519/g.13377  ORF Transcript_4519/g.13377 Transcript_4519/m.13377 type:complete len:217 (+) Transcript_4519:336-986(+)
MAKRAGRRILIFGEINDNMAATCVNQIFTLVDANAETPIEIVINSSGGTFSAACCIIDVMRSVSPPVHTSAMGSCMSAAAVMLSAGEPGHRVIYPNTRVMIHQGKQHAMRPARTQVSTTADLEAAVEAAKTEVYELEHSNRVVIDLLSKLTKTAKAKVSKDLEKDKFFTAAEAVEYGLADLVRAPREPQKKRKPPAERKPPARKAKKPETVDLSDD